MLRTPNFLKRFLRRAEDAPAEPPFPMVDLSKARTGADFLAAVRVTTDKIKEMRNRRKGAKAVRNERRS